MQGPWPTFMWRSTSQLSSKSSSSSPNGLISCSATCGAIGVASKSSHCGPARSLKIHVIGWTCLQKAHVEEELQNGEDGNVEVNIHGHAAAPHVAALGRGLVVDLLTADHREDEE